MERFSGIGLHQSLRVAEALIICLRSSGRAVSNLGTGNNTLGPEGRIAGLSNNRTRIPNRRWDTAVVTGLLIPPQKDCFSPSTFPPGIDRLVMLPSGGKRSGPSFHYHLSVTLKLELAA